MAQKIELKYHIVWCTKYRRNFLQKEEQKFLKSLLEEKCAKNNYNLLSLEVMEDHVHIFVGASSRDSVHRIVSQLKGFTSYKLAKKFPKIKSRVPAVWTRSYYAGTVGYVSEETVIKYIENQKNV